jgi:hypothetical protein
MTEGDEWKEGRTGSRSTERGRESRFQREHEFARSSPNNKHSRVPSPIPNACWWLVSSLCVCLSDLLACCEL